MRIKIISKDKLIELKSNIANERDMYFGVNQNEKKELDQSMFLDTKYVFDDFELDMSSQTPIETDLENSKRVYNSLKFLSNSDASDERLWSWFTLSKFNDYVNYRWKDEKSIKSKFFFESDSRRSLTRNAISRLWWISRLTYDENATDPYHLTSFLFRNSDFISSILERNFSNNFLIVKPIIISLMRSEADGNVVDREIVRTIGKYVNLLGGIYILDTLSEEEIIKKIDDRLKVEYNQRGKA